MKPLEMDQLCGELYEGAANPTLWPKALGALAAFAILSLVAVPSVAMEQITGEVALSEPGLCKFFVVKTSRGFSLLDWHAGVYLVAEGDRVAGPLHTPGMQEVEILGEGPMTVRVEDWALGLAKAQSSFYRRCKLDQGEPAQRDTVARR